MTLEQSARIVAVKLSFEKRRRRHHGSDVPVASLVDTFGVLVDYRLCQAGTDEPNAYRWLLHAVDMVLDARHVERVYGIVVAAAGSDLEALIHDH